VGRLSALDELAKKFISSPDDRETIATQAEKEAESSGDLNTSWYSKFMRVIIKKGDDWVAKEKTRLDGLLEGSALTGEKIDEFTVRKNVLQAFE